MTHSPIQPRTQKIFSAFLGGFLGLALLKFGNPPIMEKWVAAPTNIYEFILNSPWPISWAYWLFALLTCFAVACGRWPGERLKADRRLRWLVFLPVAWLVWQFFATVQSVDTSLSGATLEHFLVCAACFYLGLCSLPREENRWFWVGLISGLGMVLFSGCQQHFGGLAETRRYFFQYIYPKMPEVSPEHLKKMSSNRIFATLFYPNALAGALLLLLPPAVVSIWRAERLLTAGARGFLIAVLGGSSLACLYWSGSKGGWLLMLFLGLLALLRSSFPAKLKLLIVTAVLVMGLAGFAWKYAAFFEKGATSVSARFDYWRAALRTTLQHPLLGTGPGTFAIPYVQIKKPQSEMTRLVHNDYLEQASDSGIIGALLYGGLIAAGLTLSFKSALTDPTGLRFGVWLGLLGWALQGFFEFGLYIPALGWPAFTFLGWLLRREEGAVVSAVGRRPGPRVV